jgi:hypothetical protein
MLMEPLRVSRALRTGVRHGPFLRGDAVYTLRFSLILVTLLAVATVSLAAATSVVHQSRADLLDDASR